jgi:hypothetical protein
VHAECNLHGASGARTRPSNPDAVPRIPLVYSTMFKRYNITDDQDITEPLLKIPCGMSVACGPRGRGRRSRSASRIQ